MASHQGSAGNDAKPGGAAQRLPRRRAMAAVRVVLNCLVIVAHLTTGAGENYTPSEHTTAVASAWQLLHLGVSAEDDQKGARQ